MKKTKIKTTSTAFGLWWDYLRENKGTYFLGALSVGITGACQVFIPRCLGWAVDYLKGGRLPSFLGRQSFLTLFVLMVAAHLLLMLARMGWRIYLATHTFIASSDLRKKIWDKVRFFPKEKLAQEYTTGVLMNISTSDVNTSRFIYGFTLVAVFDIVFLGVFTLIMMFSVDMEMTLWTLLVFPILPFFLRKLSRKEGERFGEAQDRLSAFNELCSQAIATIRLQRLTQTGKFWERKLSDSASSYRGKRLSAVYTSLTFFPYMGMGSLLFYTVLFVVGVRKVFNGTMSVGDFVTMQSYVMLIQDPLMELGFVISEWQRAMTALGRLNEVYVQEQDKSLLQKGIEVVPASGKSKEMPRPAGKVFKVTDLSFRYQGGGREILKDIQLDLEHGDRLGIIGPIGSGKTTLVNIMTGLEHLAPSDQNKVLFHERPLNDYTHKLLRTELGMVPQKVFLFADSIRKNVLLDLQLSDEEIWHYLGISGLAADVKKFPQGLDTQLGEWGINLSGGQKQRLTLARALVRRPSFLFLDDCLSAVDTVTEEHILTSLDRELKDTTLVWVAHRKSTLKYCHRIMELSL